MPEGGPCVITDKDAHGVAGKGYTTTLANGKKITGPRSWRT